jgi:hypothetical protein
MIRAYYQDAIGDFLTKSVDGILGAIVQAGTFSLETTQRDAWLEQIHILQDVLRPYRQRGSVYFEYSVPRLGQRIDSVVLIDHVIFVFEFKGHFHISNATSKCWASCSRGVR